MDPDLVRQQEEAEREAMRLAGRKPEMPAPPAAAAMLQAAATLSEPIPPEGPGAANRAGPHGRPQPGRYGAQSPVWYASQFLSFALAGAILGGGLGVVAVNYMRLPIETAQLVIFGPAGIFALGCALASLFTGKPPQPRASSGT